MISSETESQKAEAAYPPLSEGLYPPDIMLLGWEERRGMLMVTYADLFQFCIFIVALVGLCYTIFGGRK